MRNNESDANFWKNLTEHQKLGEILLQRKKITIKQLGTALDEQKRLNVPVGQIFVNMNIISKDELVELLELQSSVDKMINESYSEMKNLSKE